MEQEKGMQAEILDLHIALDQPVESVRTTLLAALKRLEEQARETNQKVPDVRNHLIIDADRDRGHRIAHILGSSGQRPLVMNGALEAFTRFLRVPFVPFALILIEDDGKNTLFLQRFLQQVLIRYDWHIPQIRLHYVSAPVTAPVSQPEQKQPPFVLSVKNDFAGFPPPPQPQQEETVATPTSFREGLMRLRGVLPNELPRNTPPAPAPKGPPTQHSLSGLGREQEPSLPPGLRPLHSRGSQPTRQLDNQFGQQFPPQTPPLQQSGALNMRNMQTPPLQVPPLQQNGNLSNQQPLRTPPPQFQEPNARSGQQRPMLASYHEEQVLQNLPQFSPTGSGPLGRSQPKMPEPPRINLEGLDIGRYHILAHLGGSKSHVYKAYDRLRENDVALKALPVGALPYYLMEHNEGEEENIYQNEAELLREVEHSGLVPVWNHGKSYISGSPFIYKTMPLCEGSLHNWLQARSGIKAYSPWDVGNILIQLAEALQELHNHGKTFQNFKMTNVLLRNQAESMGQLEVAFSDLALPQDGTYMPRAMEAYSYMAPERWYGQASPAADQYGLAVLAYELLAGRPPFQGNTDRVMKLLHANMQPQPPSAFNPSLPPSVNHVLLRALSKRPESRFNSVIIFAKTYQMSCL